MQTAQTKLANANKGQKKLQIWVVYALIAAISIIAVPLILVDYGYSLAKLFLAGVLFSMCLFPAAYYWVKSEEVIPTFPIFCLAYALQFAIPIVTRDATMLLAGKQLVKLYDEDVIACLLLTILGVLALGIGYYAIRATNPAKFLPAVYLPIDTKKAIFFSIIMGIGIPLVASVEIVSSEETAIQFSAITRVLSNQGLVSIAVLSGLVYSGVGEAWHRILLFVIAGLATIRGISTGFLEHVVTPFAVLLMMRWNQTKRVPIVITITSLLLILFLSPVKQDYRAALSLSTSSDAPVGETVVDRTWFWFVSAAEYWADALSGQESLRDSADPASSRLDLIHQFSHVYSMTPSVVPYQYGATYSYFAIAFIPRVFWPNKPEAGSANFFYAVNYGIATEEGAKRSTFGIGLLTESFINFGWAGIIAIMALQGAFLSLLESVFSGARSGLGGQAVFVAFFVYFLNGIATSAEIIFGNIIQSLLLGVLLLWWVRDAPKASHSLVTSKVRA